MRYDPDKHHRRSIRLRDYDYTQDGAYFVTICAYELECIFGAIADEIMMVNDFGQFVVDCWNAIPAHFPHTELDVFVVMPNHVHGIIVIDNVILPVQANSGIGDVGATHVSPMQVPGDGNPHGPKPHSIGAIVGSFKAAVSKHINTLRVTPASPVWQRNYYEHIIRNEDRLNFIRHYIINNPATWEKDTLFMSR